MFVFSSLLLASSPEARADGGTVRLSERAGGYQVTVFTAPTALRAGPVDISVLLQDPATGEPLTGADVTVRLVPAGRPGEALSQAATQGAATNKLFYAAGFELPAAGRWQVEVDIHGPRGPAQGRFEMEVGEPLPRWLEMGVWLGWPVLPIALFAIHQLLVARARRPAVARSIGATRGPVTL
jgi:hypothetical protein